MDLENACFSAGSASPQHVEHCHQLFHAATSRPSSPEPEQSRGTHSHAGPKTQRHQPLNSSNTDAEKPRVEMWGAAHSTALAHKHGLQEG